MVAWLGAEYPNKKREMLRKDLASLIPDSSSGINYAVFDSFLFFYEVLLHHFSTNSFNNSLTSRKSLR